MGYRCSKCQNAVTSQPMNRETTYRDDGSILKEVPVCRDCFSGINMILQMPPRGKVKGRQNRMSEELKGHVRRQQRN